MKWEYKTLKLPANSLFAESKPSFEALEVDNFINELGRNGWELVSVEGITSSNRIGYEIQGVNTTAIALFFKRPLAE